MTMMTTENCYFVHLGTCAGGPICCWLVACAQCLSLSKSPHLGFLCARAYPDDYPRLKRACGHVNSKLTFLYKRASSPSPSSPPSPSFPLHRPCALFNITHCASVAKVRTSAKPNQTKPNQSPFPSSMCVNVCVCNSMCTVVVMC
jgi:hypothetical protein